MWRLWRTPCQSTEHALLGIVPNMARQHQRTPRSRTSAHLWSGSLAPVLLAISVTELHHSVDALGHGF